MIAARRLHDLEWRHVLRHFLAEPLAARLILERARRQPVTEVRLPFALLRPANPQQVRQLARRLLPAQHGRILRRLPVGIRLGFGQVFHLRAVGIRSGDEPLVAKVGFRLLARVAEPPLRTGGELVI